MLDHQFAATGPPTLAPSTLCPLPSALCPLSPFPSAGLPSTWAVSSPARLSVAPPSTPLLRSEDLSSPSSCHTEPDLHTRHMTPVPSVRQQHIQGKASAPRKQRILDKVLSGSRVHSAGQGHERTSCLLVKAALSLSLHAFVSVSLSG